MKTNVNQLSNLYSIQKEILDYLTLFVKQVNLITGYDNSEYLLFSTEGKRFKVSILWWINFELAGKPNWMLEEFLKNTQLEE